MLQIGDKDYKPLAIPEALRIREKLIQKDMLRFDGSKENSLVESSTSSFENSKNKTSQMSSTMVDPQSTFDLFEKVTGNISTNEANISNLSNASQTQKFLVGTNPIPFYAGWDESLRKFVITNRLLSRKESFAFSPKAIKTLFATQQSYKTDSTVRQEFSKAPLQGMNAATTLYWQIPFTTYDPDQFFALGMDGFSPLGWRNFSFKHSKQTTKPILVKNYFSFLNNSKDFSKICNLNF